MGAAFAMVAGQALAQGTLPVGELADLSLEQLASVTVTSVSRRQERLAEASASIFVVTAEDIRRSGATSLYEALRLAPNLAVVRGDTSQSIASARGGLAGTANKMLFLIDGRTVYSPLFSGVFSDAQSVFIEDLARIEVISGHGSTLWGTNAVNGVINVITKASAATLGTLAAAGAGDEERGGGVRHGAGSAASAFRIYGRYFDRDAHRLASGASARDEAQRWLAGFRHDREGASGTATLMGEIHSADVDNLAGFRPIEGAHLLGRWRGNVRGSQVLVQAYYDRSEREHRGSFAEKRDIWDLEANQSLEPLPGHRLVWGGGYRLSRDRTVTTPALGFMPAERSLVLGSLYAQDEWNLSRDLTATLGLRAEHNSYTGLEWLPNARIAWQPSPGQLAWGALTRTVRSPSRIDRELVVPGFPPFLVIPGDFQSEIAHVAEAGYRARIGERATVSLTAFHHRFERLRIAEPTGANLVFTNGATGRATGLEGWGDFTLRRDWRLVWGFVAMRDRFRIDPGRVDVAGSTLGNDPKRMATLRSLWNVTPRHELDVALRYMGALPNPEVPSYTIADVRLGWRLSRDLELSLLVSNVADREHREFGTAGVGAVFGRSYFLKATWTP